MTNDAFPNIGAVTNQNDNRIWAFLGLASRGLTGSLIGAEHLASLMIGELPVVEMETEKNLEKIFAMAESQRNWILFFDEADAFQAAAILSRVCSMLIFVPPAPRFFIFAAEDARGLLDLSPKAIL